MVEVSLELEVEKDTPEYRKAEGLAKSSIELYETAIRYYDQIKNHPFGKLPIRISDFFNRVRGRKPGEQYFLDEAKDKRELAEKLLNLVEELESRIKWYPQFRLDPKELQELRGNLLTAANYFRSTASVFEAIAKVYH